MMGHSKGRIQKYRATLLLEWIARWGFDEVDWRIVVGQGADWISTNKDTWQMIRQMQKTNAFRDKGDYYQLDREKAVRYIEKYLT
jgi:hypothetical protein